MSAMSAQSPTTVALREEARHSDGRWGEHRRTTPEVALPAARTFTEAEARVRVNELFDELRSGLGELGIDDESAADHTDAPRRFLGDRAGTIARDAEAAALLAPPTENDLFDAMADVWTKGTPLDTLFDDISTFNDCVREPQRYSATTPGSARLLEYWESVPATGHAGRDAGAMWGMSRDAFTSQFAEMFHHFDARDRAEHAAR